MADIECQSVTLPLFKAASVSCVTCIGSMGVGAVFSYATFAINDFKSSDVELPFVIHNMGQFTILFICLPFLGALPAAFIGSFIKDRYGRKLNAIMGGTISSIAWLVIINAKAVWMLYFGAILNGVGALIIMSTNIVYVAEVSPPTIRGVLISFMEFGLALGTLIINICSIFFHWNYIAIASMTFITTSTLLFIFLPDTPRWLLYKSRTEEALSVFKWFYGDLSPEITQRIFAELNESLVQFNQPLPWLHLLRKPYLKPLLITQFLFFLQVFCGFYSIRTFLLQLIQSFGLQMKDTVAGVIYSAISLIGSIGCMVAVDRGGRRKFLLSSIIIVALSVLALAINLQLQGVYPSNKISWLAFIGLIGSSFGYTLGLASVPALLIAELFPIEARARATVAAVATFFTSLIVCIILTGELSILSGKAVIFWIGTIVSIIAIPIVYFYVPETKGKSLEETACST
ncbi:hypothetical protein CHUAL_004853 [Chamberlinius hualienensis]